MESWRLWSALQKLVTTRNRDRSNQAESISCLRVLHRCPRDRHFTVWQTHIHDTLSTSSKPSLSPSPPKLEHLSQAHSFVLVLPRHPDRGIHSIWDNAEVHLGYLIAALLWLRRGCHVAFSSTTTQESSLKKQPPQCRYTLPALEGTNRESTALSAKAESVENPPTHARRLSAAKMPTSMPSEWPTCPTSSNHGQSVYSMWLLRSQSHAPPPLPWT